MFKFIALFCLAIATFISLLSAQPHLLPLAGTGSCTAQTPYTINSIADLKTHIADLECIFAAGKAPDAVGLGYYYGTVLLGENSVVVQPFAAPFYQGDYVIQTTCQAKPVHLGTLKVAGISVGTAPWTLAPFTEKTAPGEALIDPKVNNIVMDFRQNVRDICPIEDRVASLNSKGFLPFKNPLLPVNCFVDIARVVGRDTTDGGWILLAKGMNNDPIMGWQTSLFYALKNFDPAISSLGFEIPLKVPTTFDYFHNGVAETLPRFGGQGLIPFVMNAKRGMLQALVSNPLVAALALKSGGALGGGLGGLAGLGGISGLGGLGGLTGLSSLGGLGGLTGLSGLSGLSSLGGLGGTGGLSGLGSLEGLGGLGRLGVLEGISSSIPWSEDLLLSQLSRSELLDSYIANRILTNTKATHVSHQGSDATASSYKTPEESRPSTEEDFLAALTYSENVAGAPGGRLEELYDLMQTVHLLEALQQQNDQPVPPQTLSQIESINQLRNSDWV